MVDETKVGSDWNEEELGVIVKDYFDMLTADLARQSYSKSKHNATVEARLIEVKTTNGAARTPFFISRNERAMAIERPSDWRIYRVHMFAREARIFTIAPPLESAVKLMPETWRASF